jgi:hypothetical protein
VLGKNVRGWVMGVEMTQTLYAHINKEKKKRNGLARHGRATKAIEVKRELERHRDSRHRKLLLPLWQGKAKEGWSW